jgi:hypothetical protein
MSLLKQANALCQSSMAQPLELMVTLGKSLFFTTLVSRKFNSLPAQLDWWSLTTTKSMQA